VEHEGMAKTKICEAIGATHNPITRVSTECNVHKPIYVIKFTISNQPWFGSSVVEQWIAVCYKQTSKGHVFDPRSNLQYTVWCPFFASEELISFWDSFLFTLSKKNQCFPIHRSVGRH
jgi:hypothetical protein